MGQRWLPPAGLMAARLRMRPAAQQGSRHLCIVLFLSISEILHIFAMFLIYIHSMKISSDAKEVVHYISAVLILVFGCVLCLLGFYEEPRGSVDDSVLFILGQCLLFAGSTFGLSLYVNQQIKKYVSKD